MPEGLGLVSCPQGGLTVCLGTPGYGLGKVLREQARAPWAMGTEQRLGCPAGDKLALGWGHWCPKQPEPHLRK